MKLNIKFLVTLVSAIFTLSASAQTLSVAPAEAETGGKTELVVSGSSLSDFTALQFNLTLPEGLTLDEEAITKGAAASGHELAVRTLAGGSRLFVLYSMDKAPLADGELLRLPISVGNEAGMLEGSLTKVRMATTDAVSNQAKESKFTVSVSAPTAKFGDANGDGVINLTDAIMIVYHSLGEAQDNFNATAADMNGDGVVDLTDAIIVVYMSLGAQ